MCRVEVALYQCRTRFTIDCQIRALLCIFPSVCGSLVIVFVSEEDFKRSLERGHSWQLPPLQLQYVLCVSLTLGTHAQRGLQYLVCVSVCVSVTQRLTFHVIIRATNDTNLLSSR